jgi:hypothetical protein
MRCETCHGRGMVPTGDTISTPPEGIRSGNSMIRGSAPILGPCPDCGGCGLAHCCDGLTAANETPEPEPPAE